MSVVIIHALRGDAGPTASTHNSSRLRHTRTSAQFTPFHPARTTRTHARARLTALFPGLLPWSAGTRKVKPIWILLKQEAVSGNGISWPICKSAPRSSQITTPAPHHSVFLQAGCPSCRQTDSVKALKAIIQQENCKKNCAGVSGQRRRSEGPRREGPRGRRGRGHGEQPAR